MFKKMSSANPAVSKLSSFSSSVFGEENVATYGGVFGKIAFYMALIVAGAVSFFVLSHVNAGITVAVGAAATIIGFVSALIAAFAPKTCRITGAIYAACEGYTLTWLSMSYAAMFSGIAISALVITVVIVFTMGLLYCKGIVRPNEKLRTVCLTWLIASIVCGLIALVANLVAPASSFAAMFMIFRSGPIAILTGIIGVLVAAFLLVFDFECIAQTVNGGLDKSYEWYAAYGLVVGIIYVYVRVLELLVRILATVNNNRN